MSRRNVIAAILALVVAAGCVRLGVWQLHRLAARRAHNAVLASRLAAPPVPLAQLAGDTAAMHYRRARVEGRWDYDHEIALAGRARQGSPGVNIVTPLVLDDSAHTGGARGVMVNRGWVYSPDATTVDFTRWREGDRGAVVGYVEELAPRVADAARPAQIPRAWRRLDAVLLARAVPYPLAPFYVVALPEGEPRAGAPARLAPPELGEGPHRSYAIQWFSFAAIAVVGVWVLIRQDVRARRDASGPDAPAR